MIYKVINTLVILCALAGCSVLQQKLEMDASAAAMIAANAGDTAGAARFKALEPVVGTAPAGLLSKFEVARAGQIVIEDGPCAPLAAGLFLHLLNKVPGDTLTAGREHRAPVLLLLKQVEQVRDRGRVREKHPARWRGAASHAAPRGGRLVDQTVEFAGVFAGHLVGDLGRQVAELLFDVLL
jgi:hypothetical protein